MVAQRIVSNDDLIEQYHQQGVVLLANTIKPSLLHTLSGLIASCLEQPTPLAHQNRTDANQAGNYHDSFLHICFEEFQEIVQCFDCLPLVCRALQTERLGLINIELSIKSINNQTASPWHTSMTYLPIKGRQIATLWCPLDPIASQSGGQEFCFRRNGPFSTDLCWQCQPGDIILYSANAPHRELGNHHLDFDRRILIVRVYGDDVCYHPKPFSMPLLWAPTLKPGDPLYMDDLFPIIH